MGAVRGGGGGVGRCRVWRGRERLWTLGSFSNDDGDGNEDVKKARGLDWQNKNFSRASCFLYISLPSLHGYDVKMPKFYGGRKQATTNLFFSL